MKKAWWIGGAVLVVVAVVAVWVVMGGRRAEEAPPAPPPTATPVPTPTPEPSPFTGVDLKDSDGVVREAAADLSTNPLWVKWLAHEDLVRRFVASVNLVAKGRSPRSQVPFLRPKKPFKVVKRGGGLYADPASFHRYDAVISVLTGIDPVKAAALYRRMRPLFDEAYREISRPGASFDELLVGAIRHLLDTPIPDGPQPLEEKVVTYRYKDAALESLSDAQRQLLRLGPDNARAVQAWLGRFLEALEHGPGTTAAPSE